MELEEYAMVTNVVDLLSGRLVMICGVKIKSANPNRYVYLCLCIANQEHHMFWDENYVNS